MILQKVFKGTLGPFLVVSIIPIFFLFCTAKISDSATHQFDVIIDTDLGGDPDDIQSLYRAIQFSDVINIKGIISTPNTQYTLHPWDTNTHIDLVNHWIKRVDVDYLRSKGYRELQKEKDLLGVVKEGVQKPGLPSTGKNTDGSNWIIKQARKYSPEDPLWILVWGSMTTTAQALFNAPEIAPNIRIYYIGSTNTEHDTASRNYVYRFMQSTYNNLWWIENGVMPKWSHETFRGVYQSGNREGEWSDTVFINKHIRNHGSTHNGLFAEKCGDAFPSSNRVTTKLKEGDSPSLLFLVSPSIGGVGDVDDPTKESWGGQFRRADSLKYPNYYRGY